MKKILLITAIIITSTFLSNAQLERAKNLPKYDFQSIHFGMALGANVMDFTIHNSSSFFLLDSVYSVENVPKVGFNINIVSNLNLHKYWSLRFMPGLLFGQRNMEYIIYDPKDDVFEKTLMKIESTFLDFPLLIKYKSQRLNNFRPYLIGGGSVMYDLAAQKRVDNTYGAMIKLKPYNYNYELGFGTDFFLQYFKFAMEIKFVVGINNILISDNTQYTTAIERMNSKMIIFSFLFEGSDIQTMSFFSRK